MARRKTRATIADVAAAAGVSTTTISRYLNGKFEFMSPDSRERIAGVIEELNYRPNNLARSLKSSKSRLIGLIIADMTNPFSAILIKGVDDCCRRYGYGLMIANTDEDPRKERDYILSMLDQRVEGFIVNNTGENDAFFRGFDQKDAPVVLAERPICSPLLFDSVRANDSAAIWEVMAYFAGRGYGEVGFFTEPARNVGTRLCRLAAYRAACESALRAAPKEYVMESREPHFVDSLVQSFIDQGKERRQAILTANGVVTLHVLKSCKRLGISYPRDIGICSFDDWEWMELSDITSIAQPSYQIGAQCVKRLMRRIHRNRNAAAKLIENPCRFIERGST